ncbi:MAG: GAF domain-containing protein [bacterium]|nr:GAF domain-containing protein [bacterium]
MNQLYDAQKNTIGAVGYFEDMRVIQETRQRLAWMLQITNEVSQADSLPAGIQPLSERIANLKLVRFCAIWTLTPDEDLLTLQGFATQGDNSLTPIERQMLLKEWPDLDELLKRGGSQIVALREPLSAHLLGGLLPLLPIDGQIESINILPLRTNARPVGVLYVGLGQTGSDIAYADELMELVSAVAEQMALLIERLINHEDMRRRKRLLTALHEASRFIRAELLPSQLWREMVRLALDLTGCTAGGLLLHTTLLGELRLTAVYNLPDELLNAQVSVGQGLIGQAAQGTLQYTNDYPGWSEPDELLAPYHFETVVAVPLQEKTDSAVSAVLFIADNEPWRRVTQTELDVLERFAAQAAVTLHTASLMTSEQRAYAHLDMLQKISNYVQMTDDMDKVLHIFLTGITAGYGLGFNRAVFLLVDDTGMQLVGQAGIGHVHESDARDDWGADKTDRVDEFDGYLHQLEIGGLPYADRSADWRCAGSAGGDSAKCLNSGGQQRPVCIARAVADGSNAIGPA